MSPPIPALNPARSPDHSIAVDAVVPLSRRAQQYADTLTDEAVERRPQAGEDADGAEGLPDDLPLPDGNLFAVAGRVAFAPQATPRGKASPLPAATSTAGQAWPDHAAVGGGRPASGRHALTVQPPALPPAAKHAAAGLANAVPLAGNPMAATPPLPALDVAAVGTAAATQQALLPRSSARMPAPYDPLSARLDSGPPAGAPAAAMPSPPTSIGALLDGRVVDAAASPQHELPQGAAEKPVPLLHAAGHAPAPLQGSEVRRQGVSVATAKPGPAPTELPAAAPTQRIATVSVPFSSWGPGHHVTASWVPVAVSGQLPPMTLRSTSESAQRAIGSALAASDALAPGGLQLTAADSADDGTSGRRQAPAVPEDEE